MFEDLIAKKGVSVYSVAKKCGLPYTTVNEIVLNKKNLTACSYRTVSALAEYFGLSADELVAAASSDCSAVKPVEINQTWAECKKHRYRFPVRFSCEGYNASRIHPLKQKDTMAVYNCVKDNSDILSLVLFGSSPTICCRVDSDLDFAVELRQDALNRDTKNAVSEQIQEACGYTADIIWMDRVDRSSKLYENICRGVKIK